MRRALAILLVFAAVGLAVMYLYRGADGFGFTKPDAASPAAAPGSKPGAEVNPPGAPAAAPALPASTARGVRIVELALPPVPPAQVPTRVEQLAGRFERGEAGVGYELAVQLEACAQAQAPPECRSVPAALLARRSEFRERAAAAGDLRAQVTYPYYPPLELREEDGAFKHPEKVVEFKSKALGYLNAAADAGAVQAMQVLFGAYAEGTFTPPDRVLALAYYLATVTAAPEVDPGQSARAAYETGLSPEERARATDIQRRILEKAGR